MITATDRDLPALTRAGDPLSVSDAGLFLLIDELRTREKRRDDLLDRLSIEESDQIEAAAKRACDAARAIYERIAAIKPTTAAGVLRQLELAAKGWVAPSTVPIAMAALREIADRPPPFKMGRLPPAPHASGVRHFEPLERQSASTPSNPADGQQRRDVERVTSEVSSVFEPARWAPTPSTENAQSSRAGRIPR